ncbi:hypothetical protein PINS_up020944 [Pythium insidiosum]|nr:hypothetical protein PINS_up020944 [Pythium insidiosum]
MQRHRVRWHLVKRQERVVQGLEVDLTPHAVVVVVVAVLSTREKLDLELLAVVARFRDALEQVQRAQHVRVDAEDLSRHAVSGLAGRRAVETRDLALLAQHEAEVRRDRAPVAEVLGLAELDRRTQVALVVEEASLERAVHKHQRRGAHSEVVVHIASVWGGRKWRNLIRLYSDMADRHWSRGYLPILPK